MEKDLSKLDNKTVDLIYLSILTNIRLASFL